MRARAGTPETTTILLAEPPPWWVATLVLCGALIVQSSLAPLFAFRSAIVSVVVLVTVWFALRCGPSGSLAFGAFIGAGEDSLGTTGAAMTLATATLAWALSRGRSRVPVDRPAFVFLTIAGATLARALFVLVALVLERHPLASLAGQLHADLWQSLITAAVGTLLLVVFPRLGGSRGRY